MKLVDDLGRGPGTCMTFTSSLFGLLLWVAMSAVSAARPVRYTLPTFLDTPNNITAVVGSDVILPCSVQNLGTKSVIWKKVTNVSPITIGKLVYDPDDSYSVIRTDPYTDPRITMFDNHRMGHENPRWNLQITNVDFRHAGTYECQISTKEDFARNVTLHVIGSLAADHHDFSVPEDRSSRNQDKKTGIQLTGTHYVEKGSTIDLNCTATHIDYRPKGVDWFKDGSRVKTGGNKLITEYLMSETNVLHSRLEIERVTMEDAGTYVCRFSTSHVESIKVMVLNTDSSNKRRGTGTEGLKTARSDNQQGDNSARRLSSSPIALVLTLTLTLLAIAFT